MISEGRARTVVRGRRERREMNVLHSCIFEMMKDLIVLKEIKET